MAVACPSCGTENADAAKFCSECGTALAAATGPRKERKFATALFADLVGSTSLAEQEDPEIVQSVVSRTFERLSTEVERHGGLLEKFMGDAVLALFGVPNAHEDDPERAVRAALEMFAVLSELNRGFAVEGKPQLAMRVGIEAGEILVDLERVAGARDRMVTGDAVNVAARLQSAAEPGRVIVGPNAFAVTKDVVEYRPLDPLTLKGKAERVPAFEALRLTARRGRGERPSLGLESRLVGRDEELSVLEQTFHRVQTEGRPALVTILGPAGVGKSRLGYEFSQHLDSLPDRVYWRKGRCLAYGNLSYSALAEAVKAQCEILEDDPPELVDAKAAAAVEELFGDRGLAPQVQALVGGRVDKTLARDELFDAWRRFLERMAARYPLVLMLEDIHWADEGLLDFIDHIADWASGPILVLTLARPELLESRPAWGGGKRNYSAIYLDPLTAEETGTMLEDLLSTALPEDMKRIVAERSEGNPLFSEEIVRMFIDRGVLQQSSAGAWEVASEMEAVDVPRSIHALIAARLDSLPADEKSIVQDASVAGRIFWVGSVASLSGRSRDEARAVLGRLRVKEIIIPRDPPAFSNEVEFSFRHVLIRDVAYDSLPKSLRADKHVAVARWAEDQAGERRDEIAELLATHYTEALRYLDELGETNGRRSGLVSGAYRWARSAGERAYRLGQSHEAIRWFREALELAVIVSTDRKELATLNEALAEAMWSVASWDELTPVFNAALDLYCDLNMERDAGRIESRLGLAAFHGGRNEEILPLMRSALARLEPLGDTPELAQALSQLGTFHWRRGNLDEADEVLRRSMEIAARVGDRVTEGHSMQSLGVVRTRQGFYAEGVRLAEDAYRLAEETGDVLLRLRIANNLAAIVVSREGGLARAEEVVRRGLELARRTGHVSEAGWLTGTLGDTLFERGRIPESIAMEEEALGYARSVGEPPLIAMRLQALAESLLYAGEYEKAERLIGEAAELSTTNPEPQADLFFPSFRASVQIAKQEFEAARVTLEEAIERYMREGVFSTSMSGPGSGHRLLVELIRILVRRGARAEARTPFGLVSKTAPANQFAEMMAIWAAGLMAEDAEEAKRLLTEVADELERQGRPVDLARCLVDLAYVERRLGTDPSTTLTRARSLLEECGAKIYLAEVDAAMKNDA